MCSCGCKEIAGVMSHLDRYDLDVYTVPYWSGDIMYHESVMVLEDKDGNVPDIGLLYNAQKILCVRSSDLKTQYREGVDYQLVDGKLRVPKGSGIPAIAYDTYYPAQEGDAFPLNENYGDGYIFFGEGAVMHTMQIAVTYTHAEGYEGTIPAYKGAQLPRTKAKLESGAAFKLGVFGDSISTGVNSTGRVMAPPMAEPWFKMFADRLVKTYSPEQFSLRNPSLGGADTEWGVANAQEKVGNGLDLCIIGFGMNDGTRRIPAQEYGQNIQTIMNTIRSQNPDCEFILISTMMPNPEASTFLGNQAEYLPVLESMEQEGVVVADMTTYHRDMLKRKRYFDMSGNNVNHPNDFLARAYAQLLWQTVVGD